MRKVILSFSSLLLLTFAAWGQSVPPEGSTTNINITAEMGSGFAGGSITAQQVVPRGTITSPRSFFFDASGNVTMTLVGGTWQFRFCNTSGICFNSQGVFSAGNFDMTAIFTSSISSGGGGGTPAPPDASIQVNKGGVFGSETGFNLDSSSTPTTFNIPFIEDLTGNFVAGGPNPWVDISLPLYGARLGIINTTGTGSGTALSIGTSSFANGNGITIANGGAAPVIAAPTGLTATPSIAAGLTALESPTVAGATGSSTYNYKVFACDIFGGCTVPSTITTISNGNAALGKLSYTISTWSITGNTLTIVTTATNALVKDAEVHITASGALVDGWYPVSSITNGTTFVINNVPQTSNGTTAGTGGTVVTFLANKLTWTASTGGTPGTTNMPWEYGICASRPADLGTYHLVGMSYPSTFYTVANTGIFVTTFNDWGSPMISSPTLPWNLSDANCTAGAAQNRWFTTTVASGGGSTSLTLAAPLTNSVAGVAVRLDNEPAILAAANAAHAVQGSLYIPAAASGGSYLVNSPLIIPFATGIVQAGTLQLNNTVIINQSINWLGASGGNGAQQFAFNNAPTILCFASPCLYVGQIANQTGGGNTFRNLSIVGSLDQGLNVLLEGGAYFQFDNVSNVTGQNGIDNMGINLMDRPPTSTVDIRDSLFHNGSGIVVDSTWAPAVYGTRGNLFNTGSVGPLLMHGVQFSTRGIYLVGDNTNPASFITDLHAYYRQGGITPMLQVQNVSGNMSGELQMDFVTHDTESQAAYAWICNLSCTGGIGIPFRLGFINQPAQDTGAVPFNVTGGGNQPVQWIVAAAQPAGLAPAQSPGVYLSNGNLAANASLTAPSIGANTNSPAYTIDNNGTEHVAQYTDFSSIATPANPSAGNCRIFFSNSLLSLTGVNSSGLSCLSSGGGGSNSLPNNQIFVGNASNAAAAVPMSLDANIINTGAVTVIGTNGLLLPASATLTATNSLKQIIAATLPSAQIYVGNGSNLPAAVAISGDATLANTGALTLASVGTAGVCGSATQFCMPTFDAKGRETSVSTALAGVPINSTLGVSPYTMQTSDRVSLINSNPGSNFTINLFNPVSAGFGSNMTTAFRDFGTADFTLTAPGGVNLNSVTAGSLRVPGNWVGFLWSDTNLWLSRLPSFEAFPSCGDSTHAIGFAPASTPPFFCQAISTSASAGGSNTQLQYNNATALGGIAQWTTNGTTQLNGGASGVFDTHLLSSGSFLLPGNLSTGLVRVTTSTGAITSAEISGDATTSGSNALTLATVNSNTGTSTPATITVNGKGLVTAVLNIPDVTTTVGTTAIGANSCTSATTVTMTGLTSTMTFSFTPNADVSGVTGWGSSGGLVVDAWPTTNTLNYKVCNQTGSSITPNASVTFNVSAR